MRVVVTRIEPGVPLLRRMVDTARQGERQNWEELATRALAVPVPYRPVPGSVIYHVRVGHHVVVIVEHDLAGPLLDLVIAVLALGDEP